MKYQQQTKVSAENATLVVFEKSQKVGANSSAFLRESQKQRQHHPPFLWSSQFSLKQQQKYCHTVPGFIARWLHLH